MCTLECSLLLTFLNNSVYIGILYCISIVERLIHFKRETSICLSLNIHSSFLKVAISVHNVCRKRNIENISCNINLDKLFSALRIRLCRGMHTSVSQSIKRGCLPGLGDFIFRFCDIANPLCCSHSHVVVTPFSALSLILSRLMKDLRELLYFYYHYYSNESKCNVEQLR